MLTRVLAMSDPNAADDDMPPPPPPRPQTRSPRPYSTTTPQSQLDADAELALRLQQEYSMEPQPQPRRPTGNQRSHSDQAPPLPSRRDRRGHTDSDEEYYRDDEHDHSFFDGETTPGVYLRRFEVANRLHQMICRSSRIISRRASWRRKRK